MPLSTMQRMHVLKVENRIMMLLSSFIILASPLLLKSSDAFSCQIPGKRILTLPSLASPPFDRKSQSSSSSSNTRLFSTTQSPPATSTPVSAPGDGAVVGDTKGAALVFEDIAISRGSNRILSNVNFRVERNQRWGIVGPNGVGKSTLLVRIYEEQLLHYKIFT